MQDIQSIFDELQEIKKEQKKIRKEYKDLLDVDDEYQIIKAQINVLNVDKRASEATTVASMGDAGERLDELKAERKGLEELLSDISMTMLMKGEQMSLFDGAHNEYEPVYKVNFKKI